ncbi:MAG: hypothetical protein MJ000_08215 [Bacteroidales bacterium]|nr:hypothetical protein [Bacteroidales bacterium]
MAQITFEYDTSKPIFSKLIKVFITAGAKKLDQNIPNSETVEAIKEARAGKNRRFTSFDELIKDLEN